MRPSKPVCGRLLLLLAVMGGRVVSRSSRPRRSVGQFGDMIRQHVGREALLYNVYGNYCGASSRYDLLPIDEVDRCCLEHDLCYRASRTAECSDSWLGPYWTRYTWAHQDGVLMCGDVVGTCHRTLCDCDKTASECFARHPYNEQHKRPSFWDMFA